MSSDSPMSGSIGSEVPDFADSEPVGRTWADMLYTGRRWIGLGVLILLIILAFAFIPGLREAVSDNSDVIGSFIGSSILFFFIGRIVTRRLLTVPTCDFLVIDFQEFRGELYRIPVPLLADMDVSGGNNLSFSWRSGQMFRLARRVDLENGIIETAWPHEVPIEEAAFTLSDLQRREADYERKSIENLYLRRRPVVIGADLARPAIQDISREISQLLGLADFDLESYLAGLDPLKHPKKEEASDVEERALRGAFHHVPWHHRDLRLRQDGEVRSGLGPYRSHP